MKRIHVSLWNSNGEALDPFERQLNSVKEIEAWKKRKAEAFFRSGGSAAVKVGSCTIHDDHATDFETFCEHLDDAIATL